MMEEKRMKALMDATNGIREDFIEEAAVPVRKNRVLLRVVSAAAVLALLISVISLLQPDNHTESIPFFAIRAYAADGSVKVLDEVGETVVVAAKKSKLFPEKQVYTFDISLGDYTGDPADFENANFIFMEKGNLLQPGEIGEKTAIEWLYATDGGISGYRVTGWCEDYALFSVTIENDAGLVLHEKRLWIEVNDRGYQLETRISYTYREDMTTEELIREVLRQDYSSTLMLASSWDLFYTFVRDRTGFPILEQRPDAAEKLFELFMQYAAENESAHGKPDGQSVWVDVRGNGSLLTCMLKEDIYWDRLTREQQELYCTHGGWRAPEGMSTSFPGKYVFEFELDNKYAGWNVITVVYGDETIEDYGRTGHVQLFNNYIIGWFEEPTEITITSVDQNGKLLYKAKMLITPVEKSYDIDVLEKIE